jgi:hypothetical protein
MRVAVGIGIALSIGAFSGMVGVSLEGSRLVVQD